MTKNSRSHFANLPSLRGLAALDAISTNGSYVAAAHSLAITRSAISHRVADLEAELGARLVLTKGREAVLTEEGIALLAAMGDALEKIEAAVAPLQRRRNQIRLSTVSTFASYWLLPRLPNFQRGHPEIELTILSSQKVADLEKKDVDCAIRHGLGGWPGLIVDLLFRESLVPVAAPGTAPNKPAGWNLIRARTRYQDWAQWWRITQHKGNPPQGGIVVDNRGQALEAAAAGAGVVLTDRRYIEPHILSGRLIQVGPSIELEEGYYFVRKRVCRSSRNIDCVWKWLQKEALSPSIP